jgi:uncharacterized membrane protein
MNLTRPAEFDAAVLGTRGIVFRENIFIFKVIYFQLTYYLGLIALLALSTRSLFRHQSKLSTTIVSGRTVCTMHSALILSWLYSNQTANSLISATEHSWTAGLFNAFIFPLQFNVFLSSVSVDVTPFPILDLNLALHWP